MTRPRWLIFAAATVATGWAGVSGDGGIAAHSGMDMRMSCQSYSGGVGGDDATASIFILGLPAVGSSSASTGTVSLGPMPCVARTIIRPVFADFDGDRALTLSDYPGMLQCWLGPDLGVDPSCVIGDADSDQDIDLGDIAELQRRFDPLISR